MLSVRVRGRENVDVVQSAAPVAGPGQVVVRVATSGICASDLIAWYWADPGVLARSGRDSLTPGHEAAGTVEAVGSGVASPRVGRRVVVWSHCSGNCATCGHVAAGGLFCAPDGKTPSPRQRHGGQAGAVAVEAWQCMPLPDALSFEDGSVLACSGGTAYQAVRGAAVAGGEKVLVLGAGPLGLQVAQVALLLGADVIVVDANPGRLDLAGTLGVRDLILSGQEQVLEAARSLTGGFGADVVFEATGSRDAQRDSVHLARVGGRICLLGFSADGVDTAVLRPGSLITRQLTVIGSFVYPPTRFQEITAFAAASGWRPSAVVTDRFPLDSAAHAYEVAAERSRGKVLLVSEA